jgi:hypothetical protein
MSLGLALAASIRQAAAGELGLTVSIGVAPNKLLAKLASRWAAACRGKGGEVQVQGRGIERRVVDRSSDTPASNCARRHAPTGDARRAACCSAGRRAAKPDGVAALESQAAADRLLAGTPVGRLPGGCPALPCCCRLHDLCC